MTQWPAWMQWLIAALIVAGALLSLLSSIGILRMPDFYSRLQTATKASTLGVGGLVIAAALVFGDTGTTTRALLVAGFLALTAPIAAQMLSRSAYSDRVPLWDRSIVDEIADADEADRPE